MTLNRNIWVHYTFLKIKGDFLYEKDLQPEYLWYNGGASCRYLMGVPINPDGPTLLNPPSGGIDESKARIWPFKIHRARQPCEACHGENGVMDWAALGYPCDPIEWGGRNAAK